MARLLGIRIQNYRSLADLGIGQTEYGKGEPLPRFACFIGPNGAGKSTLLDALGFVADCLLEGVEAACDKPHRGGFERVRTQHADGPIAFEIFFESDDKTPPIVYAIKIDLENGVPSVVLESLRQRRKGETRGKPYHFLKLERGKGKVWSGQYLEDKDDKRAEQIRLGDLNRLGLATLGNLLSHPRIVRLRTYIEQWYLSYFIPNAARVLPPAGAQQRLDSHGANVANVLQYLKRAHAKQFDAIMQKVTQSIPGLINIEPEESQDRRLLLKFDEAGYQDPFYQQSMSDGTLKMLAYAVLLNDPQPRPFIGIEEPENGLYVGLIESLARQFVGHTAARRAKTQIFVTTHSPYFVDALRPEQVWIMKKEAGRATARRVADLPDVRELEERGVPLGAQWYANNFGGNAETDDR
ncbi:MAG: AAA family ATPase [Planctomycetes bacterium]|jgi:predicted ATPase|nr:AAA family ATPase [Planctomycetota bacterium]